jgi:hypothetical protein
MDNRLIRMWLLLSLGVLLKGAVSAQTGVTTLGIQFRPMIPNQFVGDFRETADNGEIVATLAPRFGRNVGMVVRRGFTNMWSFETGITLVQRNFGLSYEVPGLQESEELRFRFIGYELPLQGLVYVRLGRQLWMNASGGVSVNFFPTDVASRSSLRRDTLVYDFYQDTFKRRWIQTGLLVNYGFEWRTKESGYFYLGASYHRPVREIAYVKASLDVNMDPTSVIFTMNGEYLTLDLRYFFHEDPARKKRKMKAPGS